MLVGKDHAWIKIQNDFRLEEEGHSETEIKCNMHLVKKKSAKLNIKSEWKVTA